MQTNKTYVWMEVDLNNKELPIRVANSSQELAQLVGTSRNNILSSMSHAKKRGVPCRYVSVCLDDDEEE